MKTSSSTFTPKQSDCQYWYSPECGKVIVAETGLKSTELTAIGFDNTSTNILSDATAQYGEIHWICLDDETTNHIADENGNLIEYTFKEKTINCIYIESGDLSYSLSATYQYEEGMTWAEWFASPYNTNNLSYNIDNCSLRYGDYVYFDTNTQQYKHRSCISFSENSKILPTAYEYIDIYSLIGITSGFMSDTFVFEKDNGELIVLPVSAYPNLDEYR